MSNLIPDLQGELLGYFLIEEILELCEFSQDKELEEILQSRKYWLRLSKLWLNLPGKKMLKFNHSKEPYWKCFKRLYDPNCKISIGHSNTMNISRKSGKLRVSGYNQFYQSALDNKNKYVDGEIEHPKPCPGKLKSVSCGYSMSSLINDSNELYVCGGIVPDNSNRDPSKFTKVNVHSVWQVHMGKSHSALITIHGNLFTWGNNRSGQLGLGNTAISKYSNPTMVNTKMIGKVVRVRCSDYITAILNNVGDVYICGSSCGGVPSLRGLSTSVFLKISDFKNVPKMGKIREIYTDKDRIIMLSKSNEVFIRANRGIFKLPTLPKNSYITNIGVDSGMIIWASSYPSNVYIARILYKRSRFKKKPSPGRVLSISGDYTLTTSSELLKIIPH
jgi:alpha-tubulin suppressor-like RCC1 family protein